MRNCRCASGVSVALAVMLLVDSIPAALMAADPGLDALVQARADRVAALRRDYDRTMAELANEPALTPIAQVKGKYALQEYALLLDAQGHEQDAQRLRDARQKLMEETQKVIEPALHQIPAVAKLEDLGRQIAAVDNDYPDLRKRVAAIVAAANRVEDTGNRLADLKKRQADLETQAGRLKARVAAQTDAKLKARNEGLLAQADGLLAQGRAQIAELEKSSAEASTQLAGVTGNNDLAASRAAAQRIRATWNRTSRLRDEAGEILWGLRGLSTSVTASGSGSISKHTPDGRDIPIDLGKPVEILPGEQIRTGPNTEMRVRLIDGTVIELRENSVFILRGADDDLGGGALHRLNRLLKNLNNPPRRNTPTAVLAELGTDYVMFADDGQTCCAVLSGEVEITPTDPALKAQAVKALERATLNKEGWTVQAITADDYQRILATFDADVN